MEQSEIFDVIVIGAGYAGLTAARKLIDTGKKVLLLEARDRIGGRVYTEKLDEDTYVDLGGQWLGPTQDRIYALAKEFGVETFKTFNTGKSRMLVGGKLKEYSGIIPKLSLPALLSLDRALKKITKMANKVSLNKPWGSPDAKKLDSMTLASWMDKHILFAETRRFFTIGVEAVFAAHPSEISLLHALFYIKSGKGMENLISVENGAQEERVVGGAQEPANRLAKTFWNHIRLNSPVKEITQKAEEVIVNGKDFSFKAKRVIVAIPPYLSGQISYEPLLPSARAQLTQRMPMGSVIKCYAIYDKPFWRDEGLNGQAVSDNGFATVVFDNSLKDAKKGILMGFALANQAKALTEKPLEERKSIVLKEFGQYFGQKALHPLQYLDKSWAEEEWSRGCYAGIMPTGVWTSLGHALRTPFGKIHWAGTETAEEWNGYIEGAIRSGERAATEVLEGLMKFEAVV